MGKHLNFVHNDQIWKDHVHREMHSAARKWPQKWHFLIDEYRKMYRELDGFPPTPEQVLSASPSSSLSIRVRTVDSGKPTKEVPPKRSSPESQKSLKLPPIKTASQSTAFPVTTANLIGWKSTKPENNLEIYGSSKARGKIGILNIFNWPQQSL